MLVLLLQVTRTWVLLTQVVPLRHTNPGVQAVALAHMVALTHVVPLLVHTEPGRHIVPLAHCASKTTLVVHVVELPPPFVAFW